MVKFKVEKQYKNCQYEKDTNYSESVILSIIWCKTRKVVCEKM